MLACPPTPTYVVFSLTSTMCPELMRPPLDMLWMSVSSRSSMSVFCGTLSVGSRLMYDGCRRGMSGRGGAGVRGYLVSAPAGDVGDLRWAEMSFCLEPPPVLPAEVLDAPFLCLRCRSVSSLCSLIRIDLRDGLISSVLCVLDDRDCRPPDAAALPLSRSCSDSDSLERPEEEEPDENMGRATMALPLPMLIISLGAEPSLAFSSELDLRASLRRVPKSFRIGRRGEKWPSESYRQAMRYVPGAARVDRTQRRELMKALATLLGNRCQDDCLKPACLRSVSCSRGVFSSKVAAPAAPVSSGFWELGWEW